MTCWKEKYDLINFEENKGVLVAKLDRPEALNAINAKMHTEISWLWSDIAQSPTIRAVVLTGSGKAFSAGGDLQWFKNMTPDDLDALFFEARKIIIDMLEVPQPIISAVNGSATGLGATLALMSDIIYMGESAIVADTHVLAGIGAGDGGAVIWPWLCGMSRAKEFLMTGQAVTASEAQRAGLVNHVVADEQLKDAALKMAYRLADGPQMAVRATKFSLNKILRETVNLNLDTSLALEKECFHSAEHRECISAFLEKRRPEFHTTCSNSSAEE